MPRTNYRNGDAISLRCGCNFYRTDRFQVECEDCIHNDAMNIITAINTTGITSDGSRRPLNLLDACCHWTGCQGGTIHEYLPRLRWQRASGPCVRGMGPVPVWHLELDGYSIGWTQCRKSELPAIEAGLSPNLLDYLPTQVRAT